MTTLIEIIAYLIETFALLFIGVVLIRFLLQLVRADFYNPISQSIARLTNPVVIPMRKVIPGLFGLDLASLVLALLLQVLVAELLALVLWQVFINPLLVLVWGALGIAQMLTYIALICILVLVVSSFIAPFTQNPFIVLAKQIIEPIIRPIQKLIPPMGGLDFSVMFVGIAIFIVQKILVAIANNVALPPQIIIGF